MKARHMVSVRVSSHYHGQQVGVQALGRRRGRHPTMSPGREVGTEPRWQRKRFSGWKNFLFRGHHHCAFSVSTGAGLGLH